MEQGVREKVFPGAVVLVAVGENICFFHACGFASLVTGRKMTRDTVFDLASLTKPLATVPALMKLADTSRMNPEDCAQQYVGELKGTDKCRISIRDLLMHRGGFPDYRPWYLCVEKLCSENRKPALREMLVQEPLAYPPGTQTLYSDLGFMLLEWIAERCAGIPLDQFVQQEVYQPLGLKNLFFQNHRFFRTADFAATENCPWRGRVLEGEVHDENAWIAGGTAGHAGLFGTAADIFRVLSHMKKCLTRTCAVPLFAEKTVRYFLTQGKNGERTPGFDVPSGDMPACGKFFSKNTVGHLGFTGTSFWMDLDKNVTVILLTNRIHPARENTQIREFRPILHNTVMEELGMNR